MATTTCPIGELHTSKYQNDIDEISERLNSNESLINEVNERIDNLDLSVIGDNDCKGQEVMDEFLNGRYQGEVVNQFNGVWDAIYACQNQVRDQADVLEEKYDPLIQGINQRLDLLTEQLNELRNRLSGSGANVDADDIFVRSPAGLSYHTCSQSSTNGPLDGIPFTLITCRWTTPDNLHGFQFALMHRNGEMYYRSAYNNNKRNWAILGSTTSLVSSATIQNMNVQE